MRQIASLWALLLALQANAQGLHLDVPPASAPLAMKTIELEWDSVDNAGSYEVKLLPEDALVPMQFTTQEAKLVQQVPVGNYTLQVRARSTDGSDYSPWSEPMPFAVVVKELQPLHPEDKSVVPSDGVSKQTVEFRWTPVEKVKLYTLVVWSEEKKETPYIFNTKETFKKLEVPAAQVYFWQVKFESADNVAYAQQPKTFTFTLLGKHLLKPEINSKSPPPLTELTWRASPDAKEYAAKIYYRCLDESEWKPLREAKLAGTSWAIGKLKAGAYKLEVIARAPRHIDSEAAVYQFVIKPAQADLEQALASSRL